MKHFCAEYTFFPLSLNELVKKTLLSEFALLQKRIPKLLFISKDQHFYQINFIFLTANANLKTVRFRC